MAATAPMTSRETTATTTTATTTTSCRTFFATRVSLEWVFGRVEAVARGPPPLRAPALGIGHLRQQQTPVPLLPGRLAEERAGARPPQVLV